MKQALEWLILRSDVSNYRISKQTGIAESTLSDYVKGKSDIGNMTLDTASKLYDYYKEVLEDMEKQYGSVTYEGKEYILTQQAKLNHTQGLDFIGENHYLAHALDADGSEYHVYWDVVDGYEQMDDASNHCNWDNPREVIES